MKKVIAVFLLLLVFILSACNLLVKNELIETSWSPNNTYYLEAYLSNPGATGSYSILVYMTDNGEKLLIYNKYRCDEVNIQWINDEVVQINGRTLDCSKHEIYDWHQK